MVLMRAAFIAFCCLALVEHLRAADVDVGHHILLPNTRNQTVEIFVRGGDVVAGLNLFVQVGDGGPELSEFGLQAGDDGPQITSVDLKTDTIFMAVTSAQDDRTRVPQVAVSSIEFSAQLGSTVADGLLATVVLDTHGFTDGQWDLRLKGVLPNMPGGPFDTDFAGLPITIQNGNIEIQGFPQGDFDQNMIVDSDDINLLVAGIRSQDNDDRYDLNVSGTVDSDDLDAMIHEVIYTYYGDANLDLEFNSEDLVAAFVAGQYEDSVAGNSTWATGDWDGDGDFTSDDIVLSFIDGGYNLGQRQAVRAVPETYSVTALWIALLVLRMVSFRQVDVFRGRPSPRRVGATDLGNASAQNRV